MRSPISTILAKGLFMIGKKDETYYIITSNKVTNEKKMRP
jgi:hypothetical protein